MKQISIMNYVYRGESARKISGAKDFKVAIFKCLPYLILPRHCLVATLFSAFQRNAHNKVYIGEPGIVTIFFPFSRKNFPNVFLVPTTSHAFLLTISKIQC